MKKGELPEEQVDHTLDALRDKLRMAAGKGASRDKAEHEPVTSIAKVEQDRSRKNSRVKGNRAELDVAEMFSRWSGELVRRTPGSGGWSNAKFGVTADLVCANKAFPYHVEVKHREGWVLDDLVTGVRRDHDKSIVQWWIQCVKSCPKTDDKTNMYSTRGRFLLKKEPLLVFRRNRQPWLVMARRDGIRQEVGAGALLGDIPVGFDLAVAVAVVVMRLDVFLDLELVPEGLKNFKRLR